MKLCSDENGHSQFSGALLFHLLAKLALFPLEVDHLFLRHFHEAAAWCLCQLIWFRHLRTPSRPRANIPKRRTGKNEREIAWMFFARAATLRAIHRHRQQVFNPDRKDTHWGKHKLKRDQ